MFLKSFFYLYSLNLVEKRLNALKSKRDVLVGTLRAMDMLPAKYERTSYKDDFVTEVHSLSFSRLENYDIDSFSVPELIFSNTFSDTLSTQNEDASTVVDDSLVNNATSTISGKETAIADLDTDDSTSTVVEKSKDLDKTSTEIDVEEEGSNSNTDNLGFKEAPIRIVSVNEEDSSLMVVVNDNPGVERIQVPDEQISKVELENGMLRIFDDGSFEIYTETWRVAS